MKKFLSVLLAVIMIVCTFADCGTKKDADSDLAYLR